MNILAIIEKGTDDSYSIYSDGMLLNHGFGCFGSSVEEAKADFMKSIEEVKEMIVKDGKTLPNDAGSIQVDFKYDF